MRLDKISRSAGSFDKEIALRSMRTFPEQIDLLLFMDSQIMPEARSQYRASGEGRIRPNFPISADGDLMHDPLPHRCMCSTLNHTDILLSWAAH